MSISQTGLANNNYILRNVEHNMMCLTLPDSTPTAPVQAVNCSLIEAPDSWSVNVTNGGWTMQFIQHGTYMVSNTSKDTTGSSIIGAESSLGTSSLWLIVPSRLTYGFSIFIGNESALELESSECVTLANDGSAALHLYSGMGAQDWIFEIASDTINSN